MSGGVAYGYLLLVVLDWQTQDGLRLVPRDQVHLRVEPRVLGGTHRYGKKNKTLFFSFFFLGLSAIWM